MWRKYFWLKEKRESAELAIDPEMLEDVPLLYGIAESTVDTGKGPMANLKNKSTKMPTQRDVSATRHFC